MYPRLGTSVLQGSHVVFKVLNCEISFQDLEKVLNLAKTKY